MIAALLLLAVAEPEAAAACDTPATKTADAIGLCLDRVRDQADAHLNRTYRAALVSLRSPDRVALVEAQRAWLAFRTKDMASLRGPWRAYRSTRARIDAARADILALVARERQLRIYIPDGAAR